MTQHNAHRRDGTQTGKSLIEGRGITKVFHSDAGDVPVLRGVDIDLRAGELTLLMGPSGSGKTTLMSILGCILSPSSGSLSVAGEAVAGLAPDRLAALRRRHIGFVFQSYNLFPTLTAKENVQLALNVRNSGHGDDARQAEEALQRVGLQPRANAFPAKLSGGEKQRVAIARALAGTPTIILADEPTSALDAEAGRGVMALLADVARDERRAVLAVTHDHRTIAYADRILHIEDGAIVGEERPSRAPETPPARDPRQKGSAPRMANSREGRSDP